MGVWEAWGGVGIGLQIGERQEKVKYEKEAWVNCYGEVLAILEEF